jgi:hypothetical protein
MGWCEFKRVTDDAAVTVAAVDAWLLLSLSGCL